MQNGTTVYSSAVAFVRREEETFRTFLSTTYSFRSHLTTEQSSELLKILPDFFRQMTDAMERHQKLQFMGEISQTLSIWRTQSLDTMYLQKLASELVSLRQFMLSLLRGQPRGIEVFEELNLYLDAFSEVISEEHINTDYSKAEEDSRHNLDFALEATDVGMWDLDIKTGKAARTLRHDQIFGYPSLLRDWSYETFLHRHVIPKDRKMVDERFQKALRDKTSWDFRCRIHRRDGELAWIWARGAVYLGEDGEVERLRGMIMDVSTEMFAQESVEKVEREKARIQHQTLESSLMFTVTCDCMGRVTMINQAALASGGVTVQEIVGSYFPDTIFWSHKSTVRDLIVDSINRAICGETVRFETEYLSGSDEIRYLDYQAKPVFAGKANQVRFVVISGLDITERKSAEATLLLAKQRMEANLLANEVGMWFFDATNNKLEIDNNVRELVGSAPGREFTLDDFVHMIHEDDRTRVLSAFKHSAKTAKPFDEELKISPRNRRASWINCRAVVTTGTNGKLISMSGVLLDISNRKLLEQNLKLTASKLAEANMLKDKFLAMLSHELRNPLAAIRAGVDLLEIKNDPETVEEARQILDRQTNHVVAMVNDLLQISRISLGKFDLNRQRVRVSEIIEMSRDATWPFIKEGSHRLEIAQPDFDLEINADFYRLSQVVTNLITNACRYSPKSSVVRLEWCLQGTALELQVIDEGIGIPPGKLNTIFELFSQIDDINDMEKSGLGIGLHLTRSIVQMHGGRIQAFSEGRGTGSRFVVLIPNAVRVRSQVESNAVEIGPVSHKKRVLLVDDSDHILTLLRAVIEHDGHTVDLAHDGLQALEKVKEFQPDLVLMDLGMPKLNGFQAAERIRQTTFGKTLRMAALTGSGQPEDIRKSREAGFDAHFVKPIDRKMLTEYLNQESNYMH